MTTETFDAAVAAIQGSMAGRLLTWSAGALEQAAETSRTLAAARSVGLAFAALDTPARIRVLASIIAVAATAHLAMAALLPARMAAAAPASATVLVAVVATVVAILARPIVAAAPTAACLRRFNSALR